MKKLLFLLTIFFSLIVTAQETTNQANFEEEDIEKPAEFPGGPNAFLQTVLKNFRIRKVNGWDSENPNHFHCWKRWSHF